MLGLICIYYIGKYFYRLAATFHKKKWLYAIFGILSYYVGTLIFVFLLAISVEVSGNYDIYESAPFVLDLAAIPFSLATCILFYMLLRHLWQQSDETNTLDDWEVG